MSPALSLPILLSLIASLSLSSCHRTATTESSPHIDVKQSGVSLRFSSEEFGGSSVTQQPRLTADENGTDIPVDVGPAHMLISFAGKRGPQALDKEPSAQ